MVGFAVVGNRCLGWLQCLEGPFRPTCSVSVCLSTHREQHKAKAVRDGAHPSLGALKPVGVGPSPTLLGCCWDQLTPSPLLRGKPVLGTGTHSWGGAVLWGRGMEVHRCEQSLNHPPSPTTPHLQTFPIPNHSVPHPQPFPIPDPTEHRAGGGGRRDHKGWEPGPQGQALTVVTNPGPVPNACSTGATGARLSPPQPPGSVPSRRGDVQEKDRVCGTRQRSPRGSELFDFPSSPPQGWGCRCCRGKISRRRAAAKALAARG